LDSRFSTEGKFLRVTTRVWSLALLKVIIRTVFFHDATLCPFFVRPLRQLEVVTVCSLCVAFECHSFFGSDSEEMNGHGVEKEEVSIHSTLSFYNTIQCFFEIVVCRK
jgi:hypothetical protein